MLKCVLLLTLGQHAKYNSVFASLLSELCAPLDSKFELLER